MPHGFSIDDDTAYIERLLIPGLRKAGDFRSALALSAPAPTLIHNAGGVFRVPECEDLYRLLGASRRARGPGQRVEPSYDYRVAGYVAVPSGARDAAPASVSYDIVDLGDCNP